MLKSSSSFVTISSTSISGFLSLNSLILGVSQIPPNPTTVVIINFPLGLSFLSTKSVSTSLIFEITSLAVLYSVSPFSVKDIPVTLPVEFKITFPVVVTLSPSWKNNVFG